MRVVLALFGAILLLTLSLPGGIGGGSGRAPLTLTPPHFQHASGWHVGRTRAHPCVGVSRSRCVSAEAWASTVRYRDCANCSPPHKTLAALPPGGIVIQLSNGRERLRTDRAEAGRRRYSAPRRFIAPSKAHRQESGSSSSRREVGTVWSTSCSSGSAERIRPRDSSRVRPLSYGQRGPNARLRERPVA
jgi:hypothetical protein